MSELEILLIEDNPNDVKLTLHALQKNRIANPIVVMRDGAEALAYLFGEGDEPQPRKGLKLILLDLKLPKVDGIEVLRRIKADPQMRRVPVVMLTASREEQDLVRTYDLGVNSYIVKPVDFAQFVEAIRQLGLYWLVHNESL